MLKKKLSVLVVLAMVFAMVFGACGEAGGDLQNLLGDYGIDLGGYGIDGDYTQEIGDTINSTTSGMVLTWIPAGTFTMGQYGDPDAKPHKVTLTQGFYMGVTEVSQGQWRSVMGDDSCFADLYFGADYGRGDDFPMYYVSWYDAILFCNLLSIKDNLTPAYQVSGVADWAAAIAPTSDDTEWNNAVIVADSDGYRLPTEAQWEYACRAGTTTVYNVPLPGGSDTIDDSTGWYLVNSDSKSHEVGFKAANAWGLYDMHGNVWEWCRDWYLPYPAGGLPRIDPFVGAASGPVPVLRGGGWPYPVEALSSASRSSTSPYDRGYFFGFRVVRPAASH